jgi:lipid-binding SYLF domain-containing protein
MPVASAEWEPDASDSRQVAAAEELARFKAEIPRSEKFFEDAYGYAILPSITRVGFGFGGAYGRGVVVEGDQVIGHTNYWQFTSGIQGGAKYFSMIVFFKDKEALEYFTEEQVQFVGQAGIALATLGAAGTPAYNDGVAIITRNRFGLMGEFTISGARYTYKPFSED